MLHKKIDDKLVIGIIVAVIVLVAWVYASNGQNYSIIESTSKYTSKKTYTPTPSPAPTSSAVKTSHLVSINNFTFSKSAIYIKKGETVTWTNSDPTNHTVTGSGLNSGNIAQGASYSHTFNSAGKFTYSCHYHPSMVGVVYVE